MMHLHFCTIQDATTSKLIWKRMSPPPCVNYFCPMHLIDRVNHLWKKHFNKQLKGIIYGKGQIFDKRKII
ncbi:hypothetical protein MTR_5g079760 [Medicago truncatula]|uniref:Uncharacterized protein n=1 Tax=Medicago truncatula TaxID=3880 RepID=G7KBQ1_MEDTR|nr:hypothetical protein MTR_5g079760 [Medicago truncatula]